MKLNLSKNAQFYILKKSITKSSIKEAFKIISENKIGNYLINKIKQTYKTASGIIVEYSISVYKFEEEPSFLENSNIKEIKYAYLLIIECSDTLVIQKKHVDSPEKYFNKFIEEFNYEQFCHFLGSSSPEYEKMTMKNMSISNAVIRSRSLEAKSLNGIIPSNSSSRSIPSNFRMKVGDNSYTLSPNSSRISHRDKKSNIEGLIEWIIEIKDEIKNSSNSSEFLNNFASPICLKDIIDKGVKITAILIDLSEIDEKIKNGKYVLKNVHGTNLSNKEIRYLFKITQAPILVHNNKLKTKGVDLKGKISTSKNLITIKNSILNGILITENGHKDINLESYINQKKPFSAVFDSPNYSYYSKSCFEDKHLLNNIQSILKIFDDNYNFSNVISEKEKPHSSALTRFPSESLFRVVEDTYCSNYDITICDDMNDEWADHIAIDYQSSLPSIAFIHSKYTKKASSGASKFHDVVAQALKNIGRTQAEKKSFKEKYDKEWIKDYEKTKIKRVRGAKNWSELSTALDIIYQNPNSVRKIVLATPFLKKSELSVQLKKLADGETCKPHYIQLVWLINTFISACRDSGVQAHILCKP